MRLKTRQVEQALRDDIESDKEYDVAVRFAARILILAEEQGLDSPVTVGGLHELMASILKLMLEDTHEDVQRHMQGIKRMMRSNDYDYVAALQDVADNPDGALRDINTTPDDFLLGSLSRLNARAKDLYRRRLLTYGRLLAVNPSAAIVAI